MFKHLMILLTVPFSLKILTIYNNVFWQNLCFATTF